ncbi:taxadiene 5-alpha hydroxylase [Amborella trichopoda]|uniref:Cytochrome P450 n=1 Tax=Amborella trichopoda TaxID=13333 RepID=U5DBR3_AMBTC|nr:taxadiene 5-alpha hydroxylase [Amborella trichopoda]ERN19640.1 hypothetical protein AMTR_s00062p00151050 [Amborella trichopoda]|eukprot:XP_006858173.1 taxadiene 5-alpha hydroxylase [Amborella trichopoda]
MEPSKNPTPIPQLLPSPLFYLLLALMTLLFIARSAGKLAGKRKLPPGPAGLPFVGQTFALLKAMRQNRGEQWLAEMAERYGPVFRLSLFGSNVAVLSGVNGNKVVFGGGGGGDDVVGAKQAEWALRILGRRNLLTLDGNAHRRVRGAMGVFLKGDVVRGYVGRMGELVERHLEREWKGKETVLAMPFIKSLSFDIICTLLYGLGGVADRDSLKKDFQDLIKGLWSLPLNLPFTRYRRALQAARRLRAAFAELVVTRKGQLERGEATAYDDLLTCFLSAKGEEEGFTEEEIVDNGVLAMAAGHDTLTLLITFVTRVLADPDLYARVYAEQSEIANGKGHDEPLNWEDLTKMKYTWRVAQETLRLYPPIFGSYRRILKDFEYAGYHIPKGWQILWVSSLTHMNKDFFPEPSKFEPARFDNQSSIIPYSFVGFGAGPRICIGQEFAKVETLVTIHYMVTHFSWKLACPDETVARVPVLTLSKGLPIHLLPHKI